MSTDGRWGTQPGRRLVRADDLAPCLRRDLQRCRPTPRRSPAAARDLAVAVAERARVVVPLRRVEEPTVELVRERQVPTARPCAERLGRRRRRRARRRGRCVVGGAVVGGAVVGATGGRRRGCRRRGRRRGRLRTSGIVTSSCGRFSARPLSIVAMLTNERWPSTAPGVFETEAERHDRARDVSQLARDVHLDRGAAERRDRRQATRPRSPGRVKSARPCRSPSSASTSS